MSKYFLSYGMKVNEYQVWQNGLLKCRHPEPRGITEYLQLQKKINPETEIEIVGIGGLDDLAKKLMEQLREPRATAETKDRVL